MTQTRITKPTGTAKPRRKQVKPEEVEPAPTTIDNPSSMSPAWGTNTKLVIALTIIVIVGALLVKFQFIITPLVIALLLAYLFHPDRQFLPAQTAFLLECIRRCDLSFYHYPFAWLAYA